jgi:hypothetical protein
MTPFYHWTTPVVATRILAQTLSGRALLMPVCRSSNSLDRRIADPGPGAGSASQVNPSNAQPDASWRYGARVVCCVIVGSAEVPADIAGFNDVAMVGQLSLLTPCPGS